jgi:hypothetical protein
MKSKGGFKSRGRRTHGGGGGMQGAKHHRSGGGPHRQGGHRRGGPGRQSRPTTTACPMCGAIVSDLAGHVRSKHDDPDSHPRD